MQSYKEYAIEICPCCVLHWHFLSVANFFTAPSKLVVNLQELRMYNPEYLERPYIVVLNKIDLPEVCPYVALIFSFQIFL